MPLTVRRIVFSTGFPKINLAFGLVIAIVVINVCFNIYIIRQNEARVNELSDAINPYVETLAEFNLLVTESKMYATNWVYLQNNIEDKHALDLIHKYKFRFIKKKLLNYLTKRRGREDLDSLGDVFARFDELIRYQQKIMSTLVSFDDYENPSKKFECEEIIESEVLPRSHSIMAELGKIIERSRDEAKTMEMQVERDSSRLMTFIFLMSLGLLVFIMAAVFFISGGIRKPVLQMKSIVTRLGRGELISERIVADNNVVGEMVSSVNALSESFASTSVFANEIGRGNLNVPYEKLSDNDMLGNALINMRDSLKAYAEDMEYKVRERTAEVLEKSRKLEHAYKEIKDSINYASRIQESILPSDEMIAEAFSESFIFYKPKDVVCGDFYWFGHKGDEIIVAAVDCTGHGVPGALMTVIGNSLLNQVVGISGVTLPSNILSQLDARLRQTLLQSGNVITNDGMDIAISRFNVKTGEMTFSGARRPLYLFSKGGFTELKGSKSPIGSYGHDLEKTFEDFSIKTKKGDVIYMFSDGLQDQFGGLEGKKFMIKRFRELLEEIKDLPMQEQKKRVETAMREWQQDHEQTDDMLLIGLRA